MSRLEAVEQKSPLPLAPPRRSGWLRVLLIAIVFFSGVVVGIGGAVIVVRNRVLFAIHHPEQMPAQITARLTRRLHLSSQQAAEVETIIRSRQERLQAIRAEVQPRVMGELAGMEREIADVLDEGQKAQWHAGCEQQRRTWVPALAPVMPGPGCMSAFVFLN